jgi:hypothetical protein
MNAAWLVLVLTASAVPDVLAFSALYPTGGRLMPMPLRSHVRAPVSPAGSIAPAFSQVEPGRIQDECSARGRTFANAYTCMHEQTVIFEHDVYVCFPCPVEPEACRGGVP